ncbi:MAG: hypothetical protein A2648_00205 [Candidatus Lloydbacteria bacterium RIFCSPHIGHO2_01_FULL_41_20]|uniref:Prepilin-type N-terminal cleavage/methylation domain-containing protein n=1 Tax=Candidatus Lloydbacteria bacterium RIFCSPHIGHO2_01_FULL_41_20 TaxID=1798657 RepID=A0A1G2CTF3_9BACT|nr:MAG: hypothetical protein A2648_00205 [Candidatus Lloydbacteria bacterium RIFCSPHIGHO2_01_FULL_41_20]
MNTKERKSGYSMIELVIYISIIAVMAVLSVQAMLSTTRVFAEIKSFVNISEGGVIAIERIIKEIRFGKSIDYAETILDINPGRLKLNTTDENGNAKTMDFYTANNSVNIIDNGVDKGSITGSSTVLTSLVFRQSTTSKGMLVKIEMTIKDTRETNPRSASFYGSAVLRGAY